MPVPAWVKRAKMGGSKSALQRAVENGYRSGLEVKMGKLMADLGVKFGYEGLKIIYEVPAKRHYYLADFEVLDNGIILEGKGIFDATDRAKHLLVKAQYPELDIRFVFSRLKQPIGPGSKTTVEDWCKRYGFKCCELTAKQTIPTAWFHEQGPERKPKEVLEDGPWGFTKRYPNGYPT